MSERRACRLLQVSRSVIRYVTIRRDCPALRRRLRELALDRPRFGYRRLVVLMQREGWRVNHKKLYRLYKEEGLQVRTRRRKKRASSSRVPPLPALRPNERWALDFMADRLQNGARFRVLNVIDMFTRECLASTAGYSLRAPCVTETLERIMVSRGKPTALTLDNGTEFTSNHFDAWAYENRVRLDFIQPGKPVQNAAIESFNGRMRDECLSVNWFQTLAEARQLIDDWRRDYNETRPHSSLGNLPPAVYASALGA